MKIAIIHHDIEPPEVKFKELFEQRGCIVDFFDIRRLSDVETLLHYGLVFNRVYSSVSSRDSAVLEKTLSLLSYLEKNGVECVNSYTASLVDYSKFELYKMLSANGVNTPSTIFINSVNDISSLGKRGIEDFGLPLVVKRNCGGKSYEVTKVYSFKELKSTLKKMFELAKKEGYNKGFILQEFVKSCRSHDCRLGVLRGEHIFAYSRTLIKRNSEDLWMASTSGGSIELPYSPTTEEKEIALKANKVINSAYSESDIISTDEGPCVIEVNLSPSYFIDSIEDIERMAQIVDRLIGTNKETNKETIKLCAPEIK